MKKDFTKLLGIVTAVLMLQGCSRDGDAPQSSDGFVPVSVEVGIRGRVLTRAGEDIQSTRFLEGEKFNAYTNSTSVTREMTTYTINPVVTQATPDVQPFVKKSASSPLMRAYYPSAGVDGTAVDQTTTSFTVAQDQTSDENYKKSDLMYAESPIGADGKVNLYFQHRLAKIVIRVTGGLGINEITAVRIVQGYRTIDLATLTAEPGVSLSDAISNSESGQLKVFTGSVTETSCAAVMPPQTLSATADFLEVDTNGGTARFKLNSALTLESGFSYIFTFNINVSNIGLSAMITPWVQPAEEYVENEL